MSIVGSPRTLLRSCSQPKKRYRCRAVGITHQIDPADVVGMAIRVRPRRSEKKWDRHAGNTGDLHCARASNDVNARQAVVNDARAPLRPVLVITHVLSLFEKVEVEQSDEPDGQG